MKKNVLRVIALCTIATISLSGCGGKEAPSPDELNQNIQVQTQNGETEIGHETDEETNQEENGNTEHTEAAKGTDTNSVDGSNGGTKNSGSDATADESETATKIGSKEDVSVEKETKQTNQDSPQNQNNRNAFVQVSEGPVYAISEETKTYIDMFGIQTIEKKYVIPYNADIRDIAPATITTNNVQYAIDSIVNPQNFEEKKLVKENIADTEEEAKKFAAEIEYSDTDGTGVLTLDPNTVKVELNKNEKIPSGTSIVKTYDMAIKDQDKIPQTLKSGGITYYQNKVTWTNMGDPGTGISGTDGNNAYGTYNTIASSWRATVSYHGTKYTEDKDYKGTATYVGKILVKNSPTNIYVVTYKPNSMVANASGIYYNNYVNSTFNKENAKLAAANPVDMMGMYSTGGYNNGLATGATLIPWIMLYVIAIVGACIAFKTWKRANKDPEEVVATISEEEIPVELDSEETENSDVPL